MARYHGQTLPWPVPQEQDAQGEADEDPKEPKVNRVHISYLCFKNNCLNLMFLRPSLLCKYFSAAFCSTAEEDREVVSY